MATDIETGIEAFPSSATANFDGLACGEINVHPPELVCTIGVSGKIAKPISASVSKP